MLVRHLKKVSVSRIQIIQTVLVSIEALSMDDKVKAITIAKKWIVGDKIDTGHK